MKRLFAVCGMLLLVGAGCVQTDRPEWSDATIRARKAAKGIAPCEAEKQLPAAVWAQPMGVGALEAVGFKPLLDEGYAVAAICSQEMTDHVVAIFAKEELTVPSEGASPTCVDACDRDIVALADLQTSEVVRKELAEPLGIHAETYDSYCLLDGMHMRSIRTVQSLQFYCGTGESGGLTAWYDYSFDTGDLRVVQTMTSRDPEAFDVREPELLAAFRYKSNADIPN